jgi:putative peptide zinc metalloprotease protein
MSIVATLESKPSTAGPDLTALEEMPRLNPEVRFGPPEFLAGQVMQLAKNSKTGKYFRLGEREMFLLQRLDGKHTAEDISASYRRRFGRLLSQESLKGALSLFAGRELISGIEPAEGNREFLSNAPTEFLPRGFFAGRILSWNPDEWIGEVVKYFRWLINGPVFMIWAAVIIVAEGIVLLHAGALWKEFLSHSAASWPGRLAIVALIGSFVMNFHEFGHALACKRYGGAVPEMGYLFRYLSFCAFTKIDDILLFQKRLHRVYVLLIGPLISLSVVPISLAVWLRSQPGAFAHTLSGDLLLIYNLACLAQFVPFLQLDGYFILAQLLRMPDLRKDSYTYLVRGFLSLVSSRKPMTVADEHRRYLIPVYVAYGVTSIVATTFALTFLLYEDGHQIIRAIGITPSIVVACLVLLVAAWRMYSITLPWLKSVFRTDSSKGSL